MRDVQIAVIGAGPAGMAAAVEAARAGHRTALIDLNARLGGQYWRHAEADDAPGAPAPRWHHAWSQYAHLAAEVRRLSDAGTLVHLPQTQVWAIDRHDDDHHDGATEGQEQPPLTLHLARVAEARGSGGRQQLSVLGAEQLVLATGAYDRQLPVPGWTLPGVMAAGGIQAFIKVQGVAPGRRAVIAGTGPFLLAAAASVIAAGGEVAAVCDSSHLGRWVPRGALGALVPSKGIEGAEYAGVLARHRVPYLMRTAVTRIEGEGRVERVALSRVSPEGAPIAGTERVIEDVDLVGLGWGFTPQLELLEQLGGATRLDVDGSLVGVTEGALAASVPRVHLAGEVTGVAGAAAAVAEGRIAGRAAAGQAARRRDLLVRTRHSAFARAMHRAHPVPAAWEEWMTHDTTLCRCEEVEWHEVCEAREELDAQDPRTLKGVTRVGMGYCQGRICGFAAQCLAGREPGAQLAAARQVARRPLTMPIELGALADAPQVSDTDGPEADGGTEQIIVPAAPPENPVI